MLVSGAILPLGGGAAAGNSPALEALLARSKAMKPDIPNDYLIRRSNGKPYTKSGFSSNWQRLTQKHVKAGGEHFAFHDLRSVSADGADTVEEAQARLGHASVETTKRFHCPDGIHYRVEHT